MTDNAVGYCFPEFSEFGRVSLGQQRYLIRLDPRSNEGTGDKARQLHCPKSDAENGRFLPGFHVFPLGSRLPSMVVDTNVVVIDYYLYIL